MNKDNVIARWNAIMNARGCVEYPAELIEHDGVSYVITSGTGDGCYAYLLGDFRYGVEAMARASERPYQAFCDEVRPVEDEALAQAVLDQLGRRICRAGTGEEIYS